MRKEGNMAVWPLKRGQRKIADIIDIPLRNKKNEKDGQDLHMVSPNKATYINCAYITVQEL